MYPYMFYGRVMISLIYVDYVLLFGPDQYKIGEFFKDLEDSGLQLTVEEDVYALLEVEVRTDNNSGKVTLNCGGLIKKVLKLVVMLDGNKKITPAATISLETDADGTTFDEPW